jgi:lysophospholipase
VVADPAFSSVASEWTGVWRRLFETFSVARVTKPDTKPIAQLFRAHTRALDSSAFARSGSAMKFVSIPDNPCPDNVVTGSIKTSDGEELRFARWDSASGGRGTVCVFTGRGEYIEKYFETVRDLLDRGFAVAVMDWRGQGRSSRQLPDPRKGYVGDFSDFEIDVEAFMQGVVVPDCQPPYFALAHSMGGAVMLRVAHSGKRWFDRLALVAPMVDLPRARSSLPLRIMMRTLRLAGLGSSYVPGSNVDLARKSGFARNPLTSDPVRYARNAAIFEKDPTIGIGSPTVAWLDAAFAAMVEFRDPGYPLQIHQPILMMTAGSDTIVSGAAIAGFACRLPAGSHLVIEGAKHEILQELDCYRVQFWAAFDGFMSEKAVVEVN